MENYPKLIGPYRIIDKLGFGGMAVVYRAIHAETGVEVAVKTVRLQRRIELQLLRAEIRALSRVRHPGIVRILGEGLEDGLPWYAMELVEGMDLLTYWHCRRQEGESSISVSGPGSPEGALAGQREGSGGTQSSARTASSGDSLPDLPASKSAEEPSVAASGRVSANGPIGHSKTPVSSTSAFGESSLPGSETARSPQLRPLPRESSLPGSGPAPVALALPSTEGGPLEHCLEEAVSKGEFRKLSRALDEGPLPLPEAAGGELPLALRLIRAICEPLSYLHGEGLVHRDLKPENVLVRPSGQPVLLDFGLSVPFTGRLGRDLLAHHGRMVGTREYMSPEQIRGEFVDARSDLYSLGCMLFQLVTGRCPFVSTDSKQLLLQHLEMPPPCPSSLVKEVPEELDSLVLRLLEKSPHRRLGYATDLAVELLKIEGSLNPELSSQVVAGQSEPRFHQGGGKANTGGVVLQTVQDGPWTRPPLETRIQTARQIGDEGSALKSDGARLPPVRHAGLREAETPPRSYLYGPGFLSRVPELAFFSKRLDQLAENQGSVAFVEGEAGCGKTRLAVETIHLARRKRFRVLVGCCTSSRDSAASWKPLQPLRPVFRYLADRCRELGDAESQRLFGHEGRLLARYEPALQALPFLKDSTEPPDLPLVAARTRLFRRLGRTFEALVIHRPLLLVLEDLHWADELTLEWLRFLVEHGRIGHMPMLVLGTYRGEEAGNDRAGGRLLLSLTHQREVARVNLGPLDEDAVAEMVGNMLALSPPPRALSRHLAQHSGGNPFFVREYLQGAVDEGLLWRDPRHGWQVAEPLCSGELDSLGYEKLPLPRSVGALVRYRLGTLSPGAAAVANVASVAGDIAAIDLVTEIADLGEASFFDALAELRRKHVLVQDGHRFGFVHPQFRHAVYDGLSSELRKDLHRAVARRLENAEPTVAAFLVGRGRHWEEAGERERARNTYFQAAHQAKEIHDLEECERTAVAYLRLADEPTVQGCLVRKLLAEGVYQVQGREEAAMEQAGKLLREARAIGAEAFELIALRLLASIHHDAGRYRKARSLYDEALVGSKKLGDLDLQTLITGDLAYLDLHQGRPIEAAERARKGLDLARRSGKKEIETRALSLLGILEHQHGRLPEAVRLFEQTLQLARDLGDRRSEAIQLGSLARAQFYLGNVELAADLCERALELAKEVGDRRNEGLLLGNLAGFWRTPTRLQRSEELYRAAVAIAKDIGDRLGEAVSLVGWGSLELEKGSVDRARVFLSSGFNSAMEMGDRKTESVVCRELARLDRWLDRPPDISCQLVEIALDLARCQADAILLFEALLEAGYQSLARSESASLWIEEARELLMGFRTSPGSFLSLSFQNLEMAQAVLVDGGKGKLFRGERPARFPPGFRRWLAETGQFRA